MTPKEIAERLNGIEYRTAFPEDVLKAAKENGIVIISGASDDLMEIEGAITDEVGCYDGGRIRIDDKGIIAEWDSLDKNNIDVMRDYFKRENLGVFVEAVWCDEDGYSWTYETEIRHEEFDIVEDGEPYCRAIVFYLKDAEKTA